MTRWRAARGDRDEAGAVAVVVAVLSVAMFSFAAIVVDLGQARDTRVQLQTAADAAALAATNALYATGTPVPDLAGAVTVAKTYAADNAAGYTLDWGSCGSPPAGYVASASTSCVSFFPNDTRPGRVRVVLPTQSRTGFFTSAIGMTAPPVGAAAEADVRVDGRSPCALCVLGTATHSIGQGDIVVRGGDVYFNGNVSLGSNGITSTDGAILVQGSVTGGNYTPAPKPGPLLTDPLAAHAWPQPPTYGGLSTTPKTDPCTQGPGIYGAVAVSGGTTCTLSPGLYVIAGGAATVWSLSGSGTLAGTGVTLFFTCGTSTAPRNCNPGEAGAHLDGSGSRTVTLSAPTSGPLWGFTIVYDRNSTSTYRMAGNAVSTIIGSIYAPRGSVTMTGNGCISSYSVLMVIGDIVPNGNDACLKMTYDVSKGAQSPPDNLRLTK